MVNAFNKFLSLKNNKLFLKFFMSYTIMLIIPIIFISVIVYGRLLGTLEQEAIKSNITVIEQARDTLDMNLRQLDELTFQLSNNPNVLNFVSGEERNLVDANIKMTNIIRDLNISSVNVSRNFCDTVGLYSVKNNVIVSRNTKYEPDYFYNNFARYDDMDYATWLEKIKNVQNRECWPALHTTSLNRPGREIVTYLQPLTPYGIKSDDAAIIALIDNEKIWAFFGKSDLDAKSYRAVLDMDNRLVTAAPGSIAPVPCDYGEFFQGNRNHSIFENNGQKYIAIFSSSRVINWRYITILPVKVLMEKISFLYLLFSIVILVCILLGVSLSFIFSAQNYKPIGSILQLIRANEKEENRGYKGEYETIISAITGMFTRNQLLESQICKQLPILKVHFFLRLLRNNTIDAREAKELLELYAIQFPYTSFAVAVINMDDCSSFTGREAGTGKSLARIVVSNTGEETIGKKWVSHAVEIEEDKVALLINMDAPPAEQEEPPLDSLLKYLKDRLSLNFHIYVSIGVGRECASLDRVHQSYTEAVTALNYSLTRGINTITYYEQTKSYSNNIFYPPEKENQLINYVKMGDIKSVEKLLAEIYETNLINRALSPKMIHYLLNDLVSTALKILEQIQLDYKEVFDSETDISLGIGADNVESAFVKIKDIFRQLCRYINDKKESNNSRLRDNILRHIHAQYPDKDLSLVKVADHFNISPPYLSTFFKQQTGYNFSDYLNRIRVKQAKDLLADREIPVQEIAGRIGYNSAASFIRIFKKYESITPGQYKDSLSNGRK